MEAEIWGGSPHGAGYRISGAGGLRSLLRGDSWIFSPETNYEREGDVGYVTFPCGNTLDADGDGINLYYGAADTSVALAHGKVSQILDWLDRHGTG